MSIGHVASKQRIKHQFLVGRWSQLWSQRYATTYLALWVIQPWNHNWNHIEMQESCFELHCWSAAAAVVETLAGCTSALHQRSAPVGFCCCWTSHSLSSPVIFVCCGIRRGWGEEGIWDCLQHYSWIVDINGWDWFGLSKLAYVIRKRLSNQMINLYLYLLFDIHSLDWALCFMCVSWIVSY